MAGMLNRMAVMALVVVSAFPFVGCTDKNSTDAPSSGSQSERKNDSHEEIKRIVGDYVCEVVNEMSGAEVLFTDGVLDKLYEDEAKRRGLSLTFRSMNNNEDPTPSKDLRKWISNGDAKIEHCAAQQSNCLHLWMMQGKPMPPLGGVLVKPGGFSSSTEQQRGIAAARMLAKRILAVYEHGGIVDEDEETGKRFIQVQWRLSHMCFMRAKSATDADSAKEDEELSRRLDECNSALKKMLSAMEASKSPREGLQLALARHDFQMAKAPAEKILKDNEDDPDANFALGMYHVTKKSWTDAERHMSKVAKQRPNEPAAFNNLAMIQLEMGKYNEALDNARKAQKLAPESDEVKDTLKQVKAAIAKLAERAK